LVTLAAATITRLIGADELLWTEVSALDGTTRALTGADLRYNEEVSRALSSCALDHPAVRSYLRAGDDGSPCRVSDVVGSRAWRSTSAYRDVFAGRDGRFQLSLVTNLDALSGRGWILSRGRRDFDDRDVAVADGLLPMLRAIDQLTRTPIGPVEGLAPGLTERELIILQLLSRGLTATAIARTCGIAEATVRKHLERIYRKFGTNDRLTTVRQALDLGLLAGRPL
jgi:DNA-binding CsgD family transcriptional regulator